MNKNLKPNLSALLLASLMIFAISCSKKQKECPDGYNYSIQNNPPTKAAASEYCQTEEDAYYTAVDDSAAYTIVVREKMHMGLTSPKDIQNAFWADFDYEYVSKETFSDTIERAMYVIDLWKELNGGSLHPTQNPETMGEFYESCTTYFDKCDSLVIKWDAWQDCEKNVGIEEFEWVNDPCGGYWRGR